MEFKREEVIQNLAVVCRAFNGNLDQHQYLQGALSWINDQLEKVEQFKAAKEAVLDKNV